MNKKIKNQKEIVALVNKLKKQNKKIVTINGSFDILHIGHIQFLQQAKNQGDVLIILLNSDKSVKKYKGVERPVNSQENRAKILASLSSVDFIAIFNEINPKRILDKIKPDIHCNGQDRGRNCIERQVVEKNNGKIHILKYTNGFSTSKLIEKILHVYSKPSSKAVFLDRDGTININQPEYVHKIKDFKFTSYVIPALQKLSETGYKIIILTNQSGIGRGYFKEKDFKELNQWMLKDLNRKNIKINKVYFCPHHPRDNCSCRKPKLGMLMQAVKDFDISLDNSWLIGDKKEDIIMGREVNVKTIKIGERMPKEIKLEPNYYVKNLLQAVKIIKKNET